MRLLNKIYTTIKKYDNIVIARHVGPDPDAIASQLALRDSIRLTFPKKKVYAVGAGVAKFKKYGNMDHIKLDELDKVLLIVVDIPDMSRIDGIENLKYDAIIKIDHHPEMDIKADVSWVDTNKSSAAQMITELILNPKLKLMDVSESTYNKNNKGKKMSNKKKNKGYTFKVNKNFSPSVSGGKITW